jgi:hypothetical protein
MLTKDLRQNRQAHLVIKYIFLLSAIFFLLAKLTSKNLLGIDHIQFTPRGSGRPH